MEILFLAIGLIIGGLAAFLISKYKYKSEKGLSIEDTEILNKQLAEQRDEKIKAESMNGMLKQNLDSKEKELREKADIINQIMSDSARLETDNKNLIQKLDEQKAELENLQEKFTKEFENLANKIFEEKSSKFTNQNKENLIDILKPLQDRIKDFETKVNDTHISETEQRTRLATEIKKLYELNQKMTEEANNLTRALKGDSKTQGNWGEFILESILEKSGLQKGIQYLVQQSHTSDEGSRQKPDVIVHLPDDKHIIIDSKVSLKDYEAYCSADTEEEKAIYLKRHIESIKNHIKGLSVKKYQTLYDLKSLDFVIMFVPIEPAFSIAVQNELGIWNDAFDKNIVLISPATLLATLRTIANIWKQDSQNNNALEIAKQSGALYDKFVGFIEDLLKVGKQMDTAKETYSDAMKKLSEGSGNIIRKIENIKKLGANTSKLIPRNILDRAGVEEEEENKENKLLDL
jgi:DNA recombination protein RmuC